MELPYLKPICKQVFIYWCRKPKTIVDVYTTQPELAEELSAQGCLVTAKTKRVVY